MKDILNYTPPGNAAHMLQADRSLQEKPAANDRARDWQEKCRECAWYEHCYNLDNVAVVCVLKS